jgi:predicted nucleotide-binding protein (sugar kinase/HSP70/actin superfamily)
MKIGIPRALSTYEYPILFIKFFELLGIEVVLSENTTKEILKEGIEHSIDESCLASKVFMGHVASLIKREDIDYIFIPRICTLNREDTVCVKFYALYDICKNVFDNKKFIALNIDYLKGETEFKAFLKLGKKLGKKYKDIVYAYFKARNMQRIYDKNKLDKQLQQLEKSQNKNILMVSHPYISYDKYLGYPIVKYLKEMGTNLIYADVNDLKNTKILRSRKIKDYKEISSTVYWKHSKDLLNGISSYVDKVDGIIYVSVFPCGPDSLVNELSIRKIKSVPSINIVIDEQDSNTGLYTRLESFVDILNANTKERISVN